MKYALIVFSLYISNLCVSQSTYVRVLGMFHHDYIPSEFSIQYELKGNSIIGLNNHLDSVRNNQYHIGSSTMLTANYPESSLITNASNSTEILESWYTYSS